ncbi:MAG: hypothetical protein GF384_02090 [Elusimicrobia bacterium]|nr:hypothetical protein [Elusimicrobiota bacterium]
MNKKYFIAGIILTVVFTLKGKYAFSSEISAELIGSFQMDAAFYGSASDPGYELKNGAFMRRARIGVQGDVREWEYKVEFDMASESSELKSAFIRRLLGPGKLVFGQFKTFEGLDESNNGNDILFMERGYVSDIVPGFRIGVGYYATFGLIGFGGSFYDRREASDGPSGPTTSEPTETIPGGFGWSARVFAAPIKEVGKVVHFGGSYARENTEDNGGRVRVRPLGRADVYDNGEPFRFVVFDRRDEKATINRMNVEGVAINGPIMLQAEYLTGTAQTASLPDDDFMASYTQVSWIVTGESREYDFIRGEIRRPVPSRTAGAVELAYRIQTVKRSNVPDAKLNATEYGLTYYANVNVRFLVNYGTATDHLLNQKTKLLSFRTQFDF